jgi:hypothetical protein
MVGPAGANTRRWSPPSPFIPTTRPG